MAKLRLDIMNLKQREYASRILFHKEILTQEEKHYKKECSICHKFWERKFFPTKEWESEDWKICKFCMVNKKHIEHNEVIPLDF